MTDLLHALTDTDPAAAFWTLALLAFVVWAGYRRAAQKERAELDDTGQKPLSLYKYGKGRTRK